MAGTKDPKLLRNIKDRSPEWVLDGYVPKGCVSMVASSMNMGKTHVGVWMAKEASTGSPMALDKPQTVWFNSQEDSPEMVLRPRMMVAGADPDRVVLTSEPWQFPRDLNVVRASLEARQVDMLIIDSVQTHIPGFTSTLPAVEAMEGLASMAMELNVAVVMIHHFTKSGSSSVRTSIGGAGAIQNLSRGSIFVVGPKPGDALDFMRSRGSDEPKNDEPDEYVIAAVRCGVAKNPESLLFTLNVDHYEGTKRDEAYLSLVEPVQYTADQVFKAIKKQTGGKAGDTSREQHAFAWLLEVLNVNGPMPVNRLIEEAKAVGITKRTLERARSDAKAAGMVEVIRPEDLLGFLGDEAYDALDPKVRSGWWLTSVQDIGDPPVEEWAKEV